MSLENKITVITGGTRGIGLEIAKKFLNSHKTVIITGTTQKSIDNALKVLDNEKAFGFPLNVANSEQVTEVFNKILKQFSTIDVLINNAGITQDTLAMRMKEQQWDDVIDINLKGSFLCTRAVLRPMMKARYGKIINMSSVVGITGNIGQVNYSASKSGMIGMTKSFAREFATRNICVNAIAPGFIATEMTEAMSDDAKQKILQNIPMQKIGSKSDVAELCYFLASPNSDYITGQIINVDGGFAM